MKIKYQVIIVFLLGLALSFLGYRILLKNQIKTIHETFRIASQERVSVFKKELNIDLELVYSIGSFFAASSFVDRFEFQIFTKGIIVENTSVQALEWVPVISDVQRFQFEKKIQDEGFSDFRITEKNKDGQLIQASTRKLYFPVTYLEPFAANKMALGFDLGSNPVRLEAMRRAMETSKLSMTGKVDLVQSPEGGHGFLAFLPVYRKNVPLDSVENRRLNIDGFALGVFRIREIFESSIKNLAKQGINVFIFDETDYSRRQLLYSHIPKLSTAKQANLDLNQLDHGLFYQDIFQIGGRTWLIICKPNLNFYGLSMSKQPNIVFTFGIIVTILLSLYINNMIANNLSIQKKVRDRTFEITSANQQLEEKSKQLLKYIQKIEEQNDLLEKTKKATLNILEDLGDSKLELEKLNKKLIFQKGDLEKVNLELDRFVYTASHDLRAPLRAISSFATFLNEDYKDKLDDEGRDYLNEIKRGAQRLNQLIDDLLSLSRISRIKNPYEKVDMNNLIASILERLEFDVSEFNVELSVQQNLPTVVCDRIKIGEVFLNLINNAIKFSSKNNSQNPTVEVGFHDKEDTFEFYVKDNGIGVDPQYHQQIFDMFRRLHKESDYEGTGAGLNIVKRVIDDHQGKIWIDSKVGEGATFYFSIPKFLKIKELSEKNIPEDLPDYVGEV